MERLISPQALEALMQIAAAPAPMLEALELRRRWRRRLGQLRAEVRTRQERIRKLERGVALRLTRGGDPGHCFGEVPLWAGTEMDGEAMPGHAAGSAPDPADVLRCERAQLACAEHDLKAAQEMVRVLNDWILNHSSSPLQIRRGFEAALAHAWEHYPEDRRLHALLRALQYQVEGLLQSQAACGNSCRE